MASVAKTMFEVSVSNIARNNIQNVPGTYVSVADSKLTGEICPSGFLCVQNSLMPNKGYEGLGSGGANILNGNTWYFEKAATGASGSLGDHTGIYAFNSYDLRKVSSGDNTWYLGSNFLGLELPAGEIGDFTEIIVGEQYTFGTGNFTTLPSAATDIYVTIANGLLVASKTAPTAGAGLYFKWLRTKSLTVGARDAGFSGYVLKACRA